MELFFDPLQLCLQSAFLLIQIGFPRFQFIAFAL